MKRNILYLSIFVSIFWISSRLFDIYQFALIGAIFEILWLPMIGLAIFLPLISFYYLMKEKFSFNSTYLYSILIMTFSFFLFLYLSKVKVF
jgi:hypothetical protein